MKHHPRPLARWFTPLAVAGFIAASTLAASIPVAHAASAPTVSFGVPEWPGIIVQNQIAADILDAMGYKAKQLSASPAFSLSSIKSGDLDAYLGGWIPTEKSMIDPLVKAGQAKVLTTNISDARWGLAVPAYVWDAGVHSEADLQKFGDKFDHKIYGIETGSGFNDAADKAIEENKNGLGNWKLMESSTAGMLSVVGQAIKEKQWVTFLGWEPHSMNIVWDIKYLDGAGDTGLAGIHSDVLTVVNPKWSEANPEATRFLTQFQVEKSDMGQWIYDLKENDEEPKDIASKWISANLATIGKWLDGVKTVDGKPAIDAVRAKYGS